jgi:excisionase family DNA binding protein
MSAPLKTPALIHPGESECVRGSSRISVQEIAWRLGIGRRAVYEMLQQRVMPGIRVGWKWIITRHAYEAWERTCGMRQHSGLAEPPEVKVLN